jgi:hypothetical protein
MNHVATADYGLRTRSIPTVSVRTPQSAVEIES